MPQSFGESFVEGGVSNIKGLVDAITNLPNADISAIRERAYKLSSDVIKYTTDSQYRDSVNQEAMHDDKHKTTPNLNKTSSYWSLILGNIDLIIKTLSKSAVYCASRPKWVNYNLNEQFLIYPPSIKMITVKFSFI